MISSAATSGQGGRLRRQAQAVWSRPWLLRLRYGPAEWAWRCLTGDGGHRSASGTGRPTDGR
ncbi:DUF418 domain-containing protein [Actinoplanes italicus]|uniref:DUF418 domain-containing protein n=1 Tax=Actinoplanes italicus TaxID=113567 RepID=UPI003D16013A